VRAGDIISANSMEDATKTLANELTVTYFPDRASEIIKVGRGWWPLTTPQQDDHTPETMFSADDPINKLFD
jgi:hypothetical protein